MKIGAIGTSFIMDTILENMAATEGIDCEAIFSRTYEKGKLTEKFEASQIYCRWKEFISALVRKDEEKK